MDAPAVDAKLLRRPTQQRWGGGKRTIPSRSEGIGGWIRHLLLLLIAERYFTKTLSLLFFGITMTPNDNHENITRQGTTSCHGELGLGTNGQNSGWFLPSCVRVRHLWGNQLQRITMLEIVISLTVSNYSLLHLQVKMSESADLPIFTDAELVQPLRSLHQSLVDCNQGDIANGYVLASFRPVCHVILSILHRLCCGCYRLLTDTIRRAAAFGMTMVHFMPCTAMLQATSAHWSIITLVMGFTDHADANGPSSGERATYWRSQHHHWICKSTTLTQNCSPCAST